jgi:hypothetical protein
MSEHAPGSSGKSNRGGSKKPPPRTSRPVPVNAAQARFAPQMNKMIKTLRSLHYSY